ncbi:MAG: PfkB family carbohydrate kinase [Planctomycetota bacterium]
MSKRAEIAADAAAGLRRFAERPEPSPVLIGFDGFVDSIIRVVDKRQDVDRYEAVPTIADFGGRISAKAGQSSNYELVVTLEKLGGNGPIMANAMAAGGAAVSYVGCLGYPSLHPVFEPFGETAEVFSVAEPGFTDALEFDDGKLMLGKYESVSKLDWPTVKQAVGDDIFAQLVHRSRLVGMTNWTMLNRIESVWSHIGDLLAAEQKESDEIARKLIFVDLADPAKRTPDDIRKVFALLSKMQAAADVVLGLNLSEATQALQVLGLPVPGDAEAAIEATAAAIRDKMAIHACVVHPRKGAAAAVKDAHGDGVTSAEFAGPFVERPKLSTGAGDNFNAGFCLGLLAGLPVAQCLCTGVGTSGYYVRNARSPELAELADFCDELPPPSA